MTRSKRAVRLESCSGSVITHRLFLDDVDISAHVLGMTLSIQPDRGHPEPDLMLRLVPPVIDGITLEQVHVKLVRDNHDLLVRLGWTPPPEEATHDIH